MLVARRSAGVVPEVNLRECTSHMPPPNPEETSPEVQNKGFSSPTKRTYVLQFFLKKDVFILFSVSVFELFFKSNPIIDKELLTKKSSFEVAFTAGSVLFVSECVSLNIY